MLIIERVAALNRAHVFANLHDHVLAEVAQIVEEVTAESGDVIIEDGSHESWMFVLVEGSVAIDRGDGDIVHLAPGSVFGELAVLDPAPRSGSVTATEPCLLFRIDHAPFREVMSEQPEVMGSLITMLVRRIRGVVP